MERVFHVGRRVLHPVEPLMVGLVLGEEKPLRALAMQVHRAEIGVLGHDRLDAARLPRVHAGPRGIRVIRPGVAKP